MDNNQKKIYLSYISEVLSQQPKIPLIFQACRQHVLFIDKKKIVYMKHSINALRKLKTCSGAIN